MMKILKWMFVLMVLGGAGSAWADGDHDHWHGHGHNSVHLGIGIGIGEPYWGAPWHYQPYGYPYSYYAPYYQPIIVAAPLAPPVYIEQTPAPAPQTNYWYYCTASRTYYPYVKECPAGWQQVVPQPPQP